MTETLQIKNGDFVINAYGQVRTVANQAKSRQTIQQVLTTRPVGDHPGAALDDFVASTEDVFRIQARLSREIRDTLAELQELQETYQRPDRTAEEVIAAIQGIQVFPMTNAADQSARTSYAFRLGVITERGLTVAVSGQIVEAT